MWTKTRNMGSFWRTNKHLCISVLRVSKSLIFRKRVGLPIFSEGLSLLIVSFKTTIKLIVLEFRHSQAATSMVISFYLTDPPPVVSFLPPPPHCLISCKISTLNLSHSQPLFSRDSYLFPSACWKVKHWWKTAGMQTTVMWFVGGHLGCTACQRSSGIHGWLPPCPVTSLHDLCPHLRMDWCLRCLVV